MQHSPAVIAQDAARGMRSDTVLGLRLLVVEDEAMVAMLVEDMLTDLGCVVAAVAGSVAAAIAVAGRCDAVFDGALLDVNLGGEMVFPVADTLAARGVPFLFATGYGRAGIEARFVSAPVISKPFGFDSLRTALSGLKTQRRQDVLF
jgi:CheY-like chemotaxis protein